jgi:hypothetical protein
MGDMRYSYKISVENLQGGDHSEDLGVDGRIILNNVSYGNRVERCGMDARGSGQ